MADSLETLNEKLDLLLLDFFEKLEALEDLRNALTNSMRNGFLSMSKARYSMGNRSVSEMQYARNMAASTKVFERDICEVEGEKNTIKTDLRAFEVLLDADKLQKKSDNVMENLLESDKTGLRKRVGKSHQEEAQKDIVDEKETISVAGKKATDPLKWFGVLVPTSLKDCQQEFKTACRLSCEVAQLERELGGIMSDYEKLKETKKVVQALDVDKDKKC